MGESNDPSALENPFNQSEYGNQYDAVNNDLPYGLVVRIPGFHPGGPGSIPGVGTFLLNWVN